MLVLAMLDICRCCGQAVNDALQPGGGAASDDSSSDDRGDEAFARQESKQESCSQDGGVDGANSSRGSGTGTDIGIFQEVGVRFYYYYK